MKTKFFFLLQSRRGISWLVAILLKVNLANGQQFYGLNSWMTGTIGVTGSVSPGNNTTPQITFFPDGKFNSYTTAISNFGPGMLRYGGISHDLNLATHTSTISTVSQYTDIVTTCNNLGVTR